ncbi:Microcystin dependent protein [Labilithrix luteola]|uniref:Microcystin dependent protein n=1 Tax=Labilithrix luteola TaxID=1391654 RepID=A0A0K1QCW9_9BACT|nr:tail fiber protein [Labilithrix luteola]AKV03631.1 Microcystin dependent protein [Labilithrix luteola]
MTDQYVAEIRMFAGNFAPYGWALCNGQLLPISQNTALFSLLGTFYGGDGKSTFGLPNLQGMTPLGFGQGPGLSDRVLAETGGTQTVTLSDLQLPSHTHTARASTAAANTGDPSNALLAATAAANPLYVGSNASALTMNPGTLPPVPGRQPHNNVQPYLVVNFIIALNGIFPPRG